MLGYAFMGKAHSRALRAVQELDPPLVPKLVSISGRNRDAAAAVARRYGWSEFVTDWRLQVADKRVQLFDNGGPNDVHAEPTIAAARAGKHVFCEKPLGLDAAEAHTMWRAAEDAGVVHQCGFNYRFVPAVRLAREMIERGEIGRVVHFRARYLQSWGWDAPLDNWRFSRERAATGAIGDLGTHIIDLSRYLVGELATVSAEVKTYIEGHEVDDAFVAAVEFENGAIGTLEASRLARGRVNSNAWEINGSEGSIAFDVERMNELQVSDGPGFRRVLVTEPEHPFMQFWWPPGHIIGWGDTFTHEFHHFLSAIARVNTVAPHAATFEDGYRCAEICDALLRAAQRGLREPIAYRA
jgi:predicted dehydrogenase